MKIIVAHPGKQHSYRLASALKKSGDLLYYVTTLYDKKASWLMELIKKFLSQDNQKRVNSRKNKDLCDNEVVVFCQYAGFLEALMVRLDKFRNLYRRIQKFDADIFGRKLAEFAIKEGADAVICYDSNATACFSYLKSHAPHIVRIMDVSIAARHYMKDIYDKEIVSSGCNDLFLENQYMWDEKRMLAMQQEINDTHYFLSASHFVEDSLIARGVKRELIKIVPYGANVESDIQKNKIEDGIPIEFLFVGQVIYRKGITYALEAVASFDGTKARLTVTGNVNRDSWFVERYLTYDNIRFTGSVTIDRMKQIYEQANVFILPSFAEGMAQVGIEALACGLPIICTYNSGVADLVKDGVNGFVIPVGDREALIQKMQWFIDNPSKILEMGKAAKNIAKAYSWGEYEKNVVNIIREVVTEKSN